MWRNRVKSILRWSWKGIEVWSALSALGVTSFLRAALTGVVAGWSWYDQLFLFGGIFLLVLGVLALCSPRLRQWIELKGGTQQREPMPLPVAQVKGKPDKLMLVVRAIVEAEQIIPKGKDITVYISGNNQLSAMHAEELRDILLKLQDDEKVLKIKSFPNWLLSPTELTKNILVQKMEAILEPAKYKFTIEKLPGFDRYAKKALRLIV